MQVAVIGNYNSSIYNFEPDQRETATGLIDFTLKLTSDFEGQQTDDFLTGMGGVSVTYLPERARNPLYLKFLAVLPGFDEFSNNEPQPLKRACEEY